MGEERSWRFKIAISNARGAMFFWPLPVIKDVE
jgi:hypothetical protein